MYILWVLSSPPFPFSVGGLKRDLLHSSFGTKYAPWQTPRLALERNPMHFIRGQVIQSDGSLLIPGMYSGTPPPPRTSSPVAPLWTQSNPRGPSQPSTETSGGPLLPSSCLTRPLSLHRLQPSSCVCSKIVEKGSGPREEGMFARRKWRPVSVQRPSRFLQTKSGIVRVIQ